MAELKLSGCLPIFTFLCLLHGTTAHMTDACEDDSFGLLQLQTLPDVRPSAVGNSGMCVYDFSSMATYLAFVLTNVLGDKGEKAKSAGDVGSIITSIIGALRYMMSLVNDCPDSPAHPGAGCFTGLTLVLQALSRTSEAVLRSVERCPVTAKTNVDCHTTEKILDDMHAVFEPMIRVPDKPSVMGHFEAINMLLRFGLRFSSGCAAVRKTAANEKPLLKRAPWMPALCAAEALSLSWGFNEVAGATSEAMRTCSRDYADICDNAPMNAAGFRAGGGVAGLLARREVKNRPDKYTAKWNSLNEKCRPSEIHRCCAIALSDEVDSHGKPYYPNPKFWAVCEDECQRRRDMEETSKRKADIDEHQRSLGAKVDPLPVSKETEQRRLSADRMLQNDLDTQQLIRKTGKKEKKKEKSNENGEFNLKLRTAIAKHKQVGGLPAGRKEAVEAYKNGLNKKINDMLVKGKEMDFDKVIYADLVDEYVAYAGEVFAKNDETEVANWEKERKKVLLIRRGSSGGLLEVIQTRARDPNEEPVDFLWRLDEHEQADKKKSGKDKRSAAIEYFLDLRLQEYHGAFPHFEDFVSMYTEGMHDERNVERWTMANENNIKKGPLPKAQLEIELASLLGSEKKAQRVEENLNELVNLSPNDKLGKEKKKDEIINELNQPINSVNDKQLINPELKREATFTGPINQPINSVNDKQLINPELKRAATFTGRVNDKQLINPELKRAATLTGPIDKHLDFDRVDSDIFDKKLSDRHQLDSVDSFDSVNTNDRLHYSQY